MLHHALQVFGFFSTCHGFMVFLLVATLLAFFLNECYTNKSVQNNEAVRRCDGKLRRPVGPLEKGLLATEEKRRSAMVVINLLLKSRVRLVPEMVKEALILLTKRYPLLRMKTTTERSQNGEQFMEYFTEVENLECNINFKVQQDFSADDFVPVFERESVVPFDFNVGPLWRAILLNEIHIVEEDLYKNSIVLTFHHVISDGLSIVVMMEQLLSYLSSLYDGQNVTVESLPFRPSTGYLMRHCCTPSLLDKVVYGVSSLIPRNTITRSSRPENLYLASYPPVFTRIPSAPNKTSVVHREFSSDETSAFIKRCKILKCSVHGAITAAAHIAMAKILQKENEKAPNDSPLCLKSSCNVNLRKECRPEIKPEEFVLCVSSFRTEISVSPDLKYFWGFAQECTGKVRWAFITGQHHKFLKQCHLKLSKATKQSRAATASQQDPRLFNLSNLGRQKWNAEHIGPYLLAGISGSVVQQPSGPVFAILTTTINDTMYWSNSYNMRLVTREQAVEFLDLTLEIVKDACKV